MTVGAGAHHRRIPDRRPRCPTDPRQRDRSVLRRFHWPIRGVHSGSYWTASLDSHNAGQVGEDYKASNVEFLP